jgi:hypothetical protein
VRKGGACTLPFRRSQAVFIPVEAMRMIGWNIIRDLNRTSNVQLSTSNTEGVSFFLKS